MPLQFKNSEGQVFLGCLGGINYCLFLYCGNSLSVVKKLSHNYGLWSITCGDDITNSVVNAFDLHFQCFYFFLYACYFCKLLFDHYMVKKLYYYFYSFCTLSLFKYFKLLYIRRCTNFCKLLRVHETNYVILFRL